MAAVEGREFRLGVADGLVRSLTFKVKRHGAEIYLACREVPEFKFSFHKSGITRLAAAQDEPREAVIRGVMPALQHGRFLTVARAVLTSHHDWQATRGTQPKKFVRLPRGECVQLAFGFSNKHPAADLRTFGTEHRAIIKIADDRWFTVSQALTTVAKAASNRPFYLPHEHTSLVAGQVPIPGRDDIVDTMVIYQTELKTHAIWVHHGVPVEEADAIVNAHPLGVAIWDVVRHADHGWPGIVTGNLGGAGSGRTDSSDSIPSGRGVKTPRPTEAKQMTATIRLQDGVYATAAPTVGSTPYGTECKECGTFNAVLGQMAHAPSGSVVEGHTPGAGFVCWKCGKEQPFPPSFGAKKF